MNINAAIQQAQFVVAGGYIDRGRDILLDVIRQEPGNETALLMLSDIAPAKENAIYCLEQILDYHPDSQAAQSRLAKLKSIDRITNLPAKLSHEPVEAVIASGLSEKTPPPAIPAPSVKNDEPAVEAPEHIDTSASVSPAVRPTKKCPCCAEIIWAEAIVCRYCGRDVVAETTDKDFEETIRQQVKSGYRIQWRDNKTAQLIRPKGWSGIGVVVFVLLLPALLCVFNSLAGAIFMVAGFLFVAADYALRHDEVVTLERKS